MQKKDTRGLLGRTHIALTEDQLKKLRDANAQFEQILADAKNGGKKED